MEGDIKDALNIEYEKLYNKIWKNIMEKGYMPLPFVKYHHTVIKKIINIEKVKKNIYDKLGPIVPYVFMTQFCNDIYIPGPYNNIDLL